MVSITIRSPSFIIDYGASRNMVLTREAFYSIYDLNGPKNLLGDNSETKTKGKGRIDIDHVSFNNVLYVPVLAANVLSVYQMTHTGSPKKVFLSPNEVEIYDIANGRVISKVFLDHSLRVYRFSQFMPFSNPSILLTHANEARKIWN